MVNKIQPLMRAAVEDMLRVFRDGKPDFVLFTTFNFSSSFFEGNVLPLLAGNSTDELRDAAASRAELNEALMGIKVLVACDRSAAPEPKGSFRYGLLPVGFTKGRFHPKIVLMSGVLAETGKPGLRLSVGSGNLSLAGWGVNREVIGVTPVVVQHRPKLQVLLRWLLSEAQRRVDVVAETDEGPLQEEGGGRVILQALLDSLEHNALPDGAIPGVPSLHFALPPEVTQQAGAQEQLIAGLAGGGDWYSATVVSPFWSEVPQLVKALGVETVRFVPSMRPDGTYSFPLQDRQTEATPPKQSFLKFREGGARYTHAKAILLENKTGKEMVLCMGSANFTAAAMMRGTGRLANVEAMLRYTVKGASPWKSLFETLEPDAIHGMPDEAEEGAPPLPPFDAEVVCDWRSRKLVCRVAVHSGGELREAVLEVAGKQWKPKTAPGLVQVQTFPFRGPLPVHAFLVSYYLEGGDRRAFFHGLVTQLNAEDDELGYRPRPRLEKVLELLRSLDPDEPEERRKRRAKGEGLGDAEDDLREEAEPTFDFFAFYQGTYKMRGFFRKRPDVDPFKDHFFGVPALHRAVTVQPAETVEAKIGRYVQLTELLETASVLDREWSGKRATGETPAASLKSEMEREVAELEQEMASLMAESPLFTGMFGKEAGTGKVSDFLSWFRTELKEDAHV